MCKVYNQIGCLTVIKEHLHKHHVNDYRSVKQLIDFQRDYNLIRQQIISNQIIIIEQEKNKLSDQIIELEGSIKANRNDLEQSLRLEIDKLKLQLNDLLSDHLNFFQKLINYVRKTILNYKIKNLELSFSYQVESSLTHLVHAYNQANNRHQYIISHFEDAVTASGLSQTQELDRKKRVIDEINNEIYGAIGEQKVVKELEKLPDDCILINDFNCTFNPPIYYQQENDHIYSVQIDHILISPSGIFLLETKNWSQHSLNNLNLRSPVQQIKRTNFALYRLLNGEVITDNLRLNKHHWGDKKIPVKNLIVLINQKPIEEFQYVKVLTLTGLLKHVTWFERCFSNSEMESIANYLRNITG